MAYIYINPLKQQLDHARQQRALLEAEIRDHHQHIFVLQQRIAEWDAYIAATEPLAAQHPHQISPGQTSLADLCRIALDAYGGWVTAQQVRGYLQQLGIRLDYNNQMAVLHNTLKRVGQIDRDSTGNTVYARKGG